MHEKTIELRWRDMDAIGHVNNAVYLTYLEEARDEWLLGVLGEGTDVTKYVIARVEIDFRAQLRQVDDRIVVSCRLESIGRSSFRTVERISTLDGTVSAEAVAVLVAWEPVGRSRPLELWEREALEREAAQQG